MIKECKTLFDKAYAPKVQDDCEIDNGKDNIFVERLFIGDCPAPCTVPDELCPLVKKAKAIMCARLKYYGIIYVC